LVEPVYRVGSVFSADCALVDAITNVGGANTEILAVGGMAP
jgi:hypothetical protein